MIRSHKRFIGLNIFFDDSIFAEPHFSIHVHDCTKLYILIHQYVCALMVGIMEHNSKIDQVHI